MEKGWEMSTDDLNLQIFSCVLRNWPAVLEQDTSHPGVACRSPGSCMSLVHHGVGLSTSTPEASGHRLQTTPINKPKIINYHHPPPEHLDGKRRLALMGMNLAPATPRSPLF